MQFIRILDDVRGSTPGSLSTALYCRNASIMPS